MKRVWLLHVVTLLSSSYLWFWCPWSPFMAVNFPRNCRGLERCWKCHHLQVEVQHASAFCLLTQLPFELRKLKGRGQTFPFLAAAGRSFTHAFSIQQTTKNHRVQPSNTQSWTGIAKSSSCAHRAPPNPVSNSSVPASPGAPAARGYVHCAGDVTPCPPPSGAVPFPNLYLTTPAAAPCHSTHIPSQCWSTQLFYWHAKPTRVFAALFQVFQHPSAVKYHRPKVKSENWKKTKKIKYTPCPVLMQLSAI